MLQRLWKCIHLIAFQLLNHFIYSLYNKCPNWQLSRSVAKSQPTMGDHKKALAGPPAVIWMPDPPASHFLPPPPHRPPYFYIAVPLYGGFYCALLASTPLIRLKWKVSDFFANPICCKNERKEKSEQESNWDWSFALKIKHILHCTWSRRFKGGRGRRWRRMCDAALMHTHLRSFQL